MRVFDTDKNLMSEVIDSLANELELNQSFPTQFRQGAVWVLDRLRNGVTNKSHSGVIVGEAVLMMPEQKFCDCGCGYPLPY